MKNPTILDEMELRFSLLGPEPEIGIRETHQSKNIFDGAKRGGEPISGGGNTPSFENPRVD